MDYRVLQAIGPVSVQVDEHISIMIAIVSGKSSSKILSNTDKANKFAEKIERKGLAKQASLSSTSETAGLPVSFDLLQNYPNPLNPDTNIGYQLPVNSFVTLEIYNIKGQKI